MRIFGLILMIIGFLLLFAAGLCTIIFWGPIFLSGVYLHEVTIALVYGGLPMLAGALVAWIGYAVWRRGALPKA